MKSLQQVRSLPIPVLIDYAMHLHSIGFSAQRSLVHSIMLVRALLRPQPPCDSILLNIVRSLSRGHQSAIKAGSKTDQVGVREIQFPIRNAVGGERIPSPKVGGVLDDMIPVRQSRHFQVKESGFHSRLQSDNRG